MTIPSLWKLRRAKAIGGAILTTPWIEGPMIGYRSTQSSSSSHVIHANLFWDNSARETSVNNSSRG